jgi:hypothetical protein
MQFAQHCWMPRLALAAIEASDRGSRAKEGLSMTASSSNHPLRAALAGRDIWSPVRRHWSFPTLNRRWSRLARIVLGPVVGVTLPLMAIFAVASQSNNDSYAATLVAEFCVALPDRAAVVAIDAGFCAIDLETAAGR